MFQSNTNPDKRFGSVFVQRRYDAEHANDEKPMENPMPQGMVERGNIDLNQRPTVNNPDKSHSSEYSTSFQDEQGREVLVPTIANGKFLTKNGKKPDEGSPEEKAMFKAAQQRYTDTGEHMGIFETPEHADAYAEAAHKAPRTPFGAPLYVAPQYQGLEQGAEFKEK